MSINSVIKLGASCINLVDLKQGDAILFSALCRAVSLHIQLLGGSWCYAFLGRLFVLLDSRCPLVEEQGRPLEIEVFAKCRLVVASSSGVSLFSSSGELGVAWEQFARKGFWAFVL